MRRGDLSAGLGLLHSSTLLLASLAFAAAATAQTTAAPASAQRPASAALTPPLSDGEVRKVDKAAGKLTLRHGPIASLDMPAMTMVFRVADPKLLDGLKDGDRIRFSADRVNGAITITTIEAAR